MMPNQIQGTAPDRETFARVWSRVMPEPRPDCPIEAEPAAVPPVPVPAISPPPSAGRETPRADPGPACRRDRPSGEGLPLSEGSAAWLGELQGMVERAVAGWKEYRSLSRRAPGGGSRALGALAAEEHRQGKRLAAVCFLIGGAWYWPEERIQPVLRGAFPLCLRERFREEQRSARRLLAMAEEMEDPALRALCRELAAGELRHAAVLRRLVEEL